MSSTIHASLTPPRTHEIRASDGFGPLAPPSLQPRRPQTCRFCLDAAAFWRSTTPSTASRRPAASTSNRVSAAREAGSLPR